MGQIHEVSGPWSGCQRADVMLPEVAMHEVVASKRMVGLGWVTRLFREEEWASLSKSCRARHLGGEKFVSWWCERPCETFAGLGRPGYFSRRCATPGSCRETSEVISCGRLWGAGLV